MTSIAWKLIAAFLLAALPFAVLQSEYLRSKALIEKLDLKVD